MGRGWGPRPGGCKVRIAVLLLSEGRCKITLLTWETLKRYITAGHLKGSRVGGLHHTLRNGIQRVSSSATALTPTEETLRPGVNFSHPLHPVLASSSLLPQLDNLFLVKLGVCRGSGLSDSFSIGQLMFVWVHKFVQTPVSWNVKSEELWGEICVLGSLTLLGREHSESLLSQVGSPSSLASSVPFWPGTPHHGSGSVSFHKSGDLHNNRAEKISGVRNEIFTYEFACIVGNQLRF